MKHIRRSFTALAAAVLLSLGSPALAAPAGSSDSTDSSGSTGSSSEALESNAAILPALGPGLIL
ncbi:peptide ABC transporter permease protein [Streptomyces sp. NBRC 110611]|uniref:hypothetical protein n=1 Tax=Streptomyces sp. NBRC 110611 TaxID=1621259 RepID=UPI00083303FB|nr:hypothetical protein [Streptomyces sp. NBRC 110611]GAU69163.1 peptide ABC transporter permease protein [Streptomyces sp. NBRC 110611]